MVTFTQYEGFSCGVAHLLYFLFHPPTHLKLNFSGWSTIYPQSVHTLNVYVSIVVPFSDVNVKGCSSTLW